MESSSEVGVLESYLHAPSRAISGEFSALRILIFFSRNQIQHEDTTKDENLIRNF